MEDQTLDIEGIRLDSKDPIVSHIERLDLLGVSQSAENLSAIG